MADVVYCPNCEAENASDNVLCGLCGHQLQAVPLDEIAEALGLEATTTSPNLSAGDRNEPAAARPSRSVFDPSATLPRHGSTCGYATASFVCGLSGAFCGGLPLGILAVVFGEIAKNEIARRPNLGGEKMALAGRVLGVVDIIFGVFLLIYWATAG
jgi:hypothetical protein